MHIRRWPLHPIPVEGEAITSWIRRIANEYGIGWDVLLHRTFGWPDTPYVDADLQIPQRVIQRLSTKTGVPAPNIRLMTLGGQWERLLSVADGSIEKGYLSRYEILSASAAPRLHFERGWKPWQPDRRVFFACRACVAEYGAGFYRLIWRLPILRSCPIHGMMLERAAFIGYETKWIDKPEIADRAVRTMDALTWQGWTQGFVNLKHQRVSVAEWLCMLRCLIEEICFKDHRERSWRDWSAEGMPIEIPFFPNDIFERMEMREIKKILEAVAYVLERIQHHKMRASGKHAKMLMSSGRVTAGNRLEAALRFCYASRSEIDRNHKSE
jgi:hypothetical protein